MLILWPGVIPQVTVGSTLEASNLITSKINYAHQKMRIGGKRSNGGDH